MLNDGAVNHVYAGPKDIALLSEVSGEFGISNKTPLEDIVSYGILDYVRGIIKPIAQFMPGKALRAINHVTHNFGWSIVILTVASEHALFPLALEKLCYDEARRRHCAQNERSFRSG